jgi:hypothetical protein
MTFLKFVDHKEAINILRTRLGECNEEISQLYLALARPQDPEKLANALGDTVTKLVELKSLLDLLVKEKDNANT